MQREWNSLIMISLYNLELDLFPILKNLFQTVQKCKKVVIDFRIVIQLKLFEKFKQVFMNFSQNNMVVINRSEIIVISLHIQQLVIQIKIQLLNEPEIELLLIVSRFFKVNNYIYKKILQKYQTRTFFNLIPIFEIVHAHKQVLVEVRLVIGVVCECFLVACLKETIHNITQVIEHVPTTDTSPELIRTR